MKFNHNKKFEHEYSKTAHNMTFESRLLAVLSCLSFICSGISLLAMFFGFFTEQLLIVFFLLVILFIMSSMRMIKVIAENEDHEKHKKS